ncbi:MAG: hypothetical protein HY901_03350 [Deltaproteobacteria bacterium]|nr:hypothetical protein [Deltaproteobacteria bacterium]
MTAAMVLLVIVGLGAAAAMAIRAARGSGLLPTRRQRCEGCGQLAPVASVRFFKNTGMVVMFRFESRSATTCRRCGSELFSAMTLHTVVFGWWGMISFFVNLAFVANNLAHFLWLQMLPTAGALARGALEDQREYALNLLATKDPDTVIDVLCRASGASRMEVERFVETLR